MYLDGFRIELCNCVFYFDSDSCCRAEVACFIAGRRQYGVDYWRTWHNQGQLTAKREVRTMKQRSEVKGAQSTERSSLGNTNLLLIRYGKVTLQNRQCHKHAYFTQRLARCAELTKCVVFELFFLSPFVFFISTRLFLSLFIRTTECNTMNFEKRLSKSLHP